ncbi:Trigger factor like [Actinidia chinensis var. chinensis]|uniref:Trigger factor like n=1 Tax=Actinidia chinensis var. chinensis TaxID=1590841 RepID=A0A2R6QLD6_ACTCC|nr:Trigger factor like [Actinidia chinensis var. chinensis]
MMVEFFLLGCTGVVVFLHGANFFFHALSSHLAFRSLSFLGFVGW